MYVTLDTKVARIDKPMNPHRDAKARSVYGAAAVVTLDDCNPRYSRIGVNDK